MGLLPGGHFDGETKSSGTELGLAATDAYLPHFFGDLFKHPFPWIELQSVPEWFRWAVSRRDRWWLLFDGDPMNLTHGCVHSIPLINFSHNWTGIQSISLIQAADESLLELANDVNCWGGETLHTQTPTPKPQTPPAKARLCLSKTGLTIFVLVACVSTSACSKCV